MYVIVFTQGQILECIYICLFRYSRLVTPSYAIPWNGYGYRYSGAARSICVCAGFDSWAAISEYVQQRWATNPGSHNRTVWPKQLWHTLVNTIQQPGCNKTDPVHQGQCVVDQKYYDQCLELVQFSSEMLFKVQLINFLRQVISL